MSTSPDRGILSIVLHTHMPYVEGFGTWPFGEEWLWEAIAGCYVPLLELLDHGAPLTLSLTPVLCDQLEVDGLFERFAKFITHVRSATHAEDAAGLRDGGFPELADEVQRAYTDYTRALHSLQARGGDLLGALGAHAQWASSATHAILPLLATDTGVRMQVQTGVRAHRSRFGEDWRGGFWLPECAYSPWLERALEDAGVSAVCVELTNRFGLGSPQHLRPIATESGVQMVPIDRATMALVWSDDGYPSAGAYRDYHHHTVHHHNPWNNDGQPYRRDEALALARQHAADFVARVGARIDSARQSPQHADGQPPLVVCALDTELFGHWWYEGIEWLSAVVTECSRQGVQLLRLDDALQRTEPVDADVEQESRQWQACTWGAHGDLSTWSAPAVAQMAFHTRAAELQVLAASGHASGAAIRQLLALQASDWAFMISRDIAAPYAAERFQGHLSALRQALASGEDDDTAALRNLAVHADRSSLLVPL